MLNSPSQLESGLDLIHMIRYPRRMFVSIPFTPREVRATEARLRRIYEGARLGLKKERLALYAGMLPTELSQLRSLDPVVDIAEMKGRADAEAEAAAVMRESALLGDAKSALAILQHQHEWTAKQEIVTTSYKVDIKSLLELREERLRDITPLSLDTPSPTAAHQTHTNHLIIEHEPRREELTDS